VTSARLALVVTIEASVDEAGQIIVSVTSAALQHMKQVELSL